MKIILLPIRFFFSFLFLVGFFFPLTAMEEEEKRSPLQPVSLQTSATYDFDADHQVSLELTACDADLTLVCPTTPLSLFLPEELKDPPLALPSPPRRCGLYCCTPKWQECTAMSPLAQKITLTDTASSFDEEKPPSAESVLSFVRNLFDLLADYYDKAQKKGGYPLRSCQDEFPMILERSRKPIWILSTLFLPQSTAKNDFFFTIFSHIESTPSGEWTLHYPTLYGTDKEKILNHRKRRTKEKLHAFYLEDLQILDAKIKGVTKSPENTLLLACTWQYVYLMGLSNLSYWLKPQGYTLIQPGPPPLSYHHYLYFAYKGLLLFYLIKQTLPIRFRCSQFCSSVTHQPPWIALFSYLTTFFVSDLYQEGKLQRLAYYFYILPHFFPFTFCCALSRKELIPTIVPHHLFRRMKLLTLLEEKIKTFYAEKEAIVEACPNLPKDIGQTIFELASPKLKAWQDKALQITNGIAKCEQKIGNPPSFLKELYLRQYKPRCITKLATGALLFLHFLFFLLSLLKSVNYL